jgi:hypothetical protein
LAKAFAIVPPVLVMFLADHYNNKLVKFFAGGEVKRSTEFIEEKTGENHFYYGADSELQENVDKFDRRAYQNNISILSGLLIAVTSPFLGYHVYGPIGALVGVFLTAVAIRWLSQPAVEQLNALAKDLKEPYKANYENQ